MNTVTMAKITLMVGALAVAGNAAAKHDAQAGGTELHHAIWNQDYATAKRLIESGADMNATDGYKNTPLHSAALFNAHEIVALLIEKGADVDARNNRGKTPLELARQKGYSQFAALLANPTHGFCHAEIKVEPGRISEGVDTVAAFSQIGTLESDLEAVYLQKMRAAVKSKYQEIFVERGTSECRFFVGKKRGNKGYSKAIGTADQASTHIVYVDL